MRVVASVQAKRGSSRGLVHYLAHSKLDPEREAHSWREIFNAFTDELSVKSANNSMRVGIAKGRPSNDELHHLVLSFRADDYRKLGIDEARRKKALKEITRGAVKGLETSINAERLLWTAAVHRNTENPHVHIAIQKQYLTKEIERRTLTKIPREILPHYEIENGEKILVSGTLIEAATDKMEAIIDRKKSRNRDQKRCDRGIVSQNHSERKTESETTKTSPRQIETERYTLAKGILAEFELRKIETRIDSLLDHGAEMRFTVNDPVSGKRNRISLREIQKQKAPNEPDQRTAAEHQIRTILHKMLVKEEAAKSQLQNEVADVIREAKQIRGEYRKSGRHLPVPALTKEDLDRLQEQCFEASDIRRFSYFERVRAERQRSGEIEPRSKADLRSIMAQKNLSVLRSRGYERMHKEQGERGYYLRFDIGERSLSLADLDREQKEHSGSVFTLIEKVRAAAVRFSRKANALARVDETDNLRQTIGKKLDEHLAGIRQEGMLERNKAKILESVLKTSSETQLDQPSYSPEQIAEIEKLSLRLKLKDEYENNWEEQRSMIESAGSDSAAFERLRKAEPTADLSAHKNRIIAGRALAREIVAKVEFEKAKEELKIFQESNRFQKFAVADKNSEGVVYLSLHDVDLLRRGSLLDRAVEELFEKPEHKALRRTVSALVADKEQRLKEDVTGAKEILVSASRNASEFKEFSYFGLKGKPDYQPVFTSAEIAMLESRISNTADSKEAKHLRTVLDSGADRQIRSVSDLLRDLEGPKQAHSEAKEIPVPSREKARDGRHEPNLERSPVLRRPDRSFEGHTR
ncbi:MAG: relaxase MobL [Pyrinomonadaceae bacterium]